MDGLTPLPLYVESIFLSSPLSAPPISLVLLQKRNGLTVTILHDPGIFASGYMRLQSVHETMI